ncbi:MULTISPECIES: DUF1918 domain-containing protein [unclassified Streptomyces]|uniref:DUF1918 domain-containing protein n=1 Tax=unclassified Streptomyces TaxID=2593676 RepID=UPI002E11121F|nr:DUF1918 domain-containing protein [Streptomyces sp. NBC_01207]WTA17142.1 DUF1918 domain-containing protein [Streptomyces sp. NBC_00853]
MRAHVGDWIVVESVHLGGQRRRGQILRLEHPDGTPPYVVRWTEDDRETVFFPGPEAHIESADEHTARRSASPYG